MWSSLLSALLVVAPVSSPTTIEIHVPLCDAQLIACGKGALGDPRALGGNLYWGAAYGVEPFLTRGRGLRVLARRDAPDTAHDYVLRELVLSRPARPGERELSVHVFAYAGDHIDDALRDFFVAVAAGGADLLVWAGHDRLMDVAAPALAQPASRPSQPTHVAVLACMSEQFFGPPLQTLGARPVALTRTLMAPEAYLLDALLLAVAKHGVDARAEIRRALVAAYAEYQHSSPRAAGTVFSVLR